MRNGESIIKIYTCLLLFLSFINLSKANDCSHASLLDQLTLEKLEAKDYIELTEQSYQSQLRIYKNMLKEVEDSKDKSPALIKYVNSKINSLKNKDKTILARMEKAIEQNQSFFRKIEHLLQKASSEKERKIILSFIEPSLHMKKKIPAEFVNFIEEILPKIMAKNENDLSILRMGYATKVSSSFKSEGFCVMGLGCFKESVKAHILRRTNPERLLQTCIEEYLKEIDEFL